MTHAARLLVAAARRAGTLRGLGDVEGHPFHGNQWTAGQGTDSWTKQDDQTGETLNGIPMHEESNPVFNHNSNINEPPFPDLPKGKHAAAGMIITEPDGRVWLVQPMNRYGGYRNTFPKGTVDRGETLQEAAAREVWEETGLVAEVTGHIADVERTTSVTRFYEGRRVGGAPWAHGKETYAVQLMPLIGKGIENALRKVGGGKTTDHDVLHVVRQKKHLIGLGDFEGHPFHGNQWTDGLGLDKNGYDSEGKPGPAIARKGGSLWRYRGGGIDAQDFLRDGVLPRDMDEQDRKDVINLDKAMKPLGQSMTVLRDVGGEQYLQKVGTTFEEKGYTSTARERGTFAKGTTIEIEVPAHAPAIRLGDYYKDDVEKEIILGRGSKFEVVAPNRWRWIGSSKVKTLEFNPDQPRDDHGQWTDTGAEGWPAGLKNISGAKGSNPGGLYKDAEGHKWYVKRYNDPRQAATEHISNEIYRAVGVHAPQSALGEGGDYASKWMPSDGTLAKVGVTPERADRILDGFAADVFLDNWDAVGTGHDNILVSGTRVTRIDQGGTLLFRAQGALKPESGLEKIDEWNSLVEKNHYYSQIFKAAGYKNGDALGDRAAKQIDRIVAARPKGGWKELIDRVAPKANGEFRTKVANVLEKRQTLLEKKASELRGKKAMRAAEYVEELHPRDEAGKWTDKGGAPGEKKTKAPKAPPVPLESKKAAYADVKAGATFKATAAKHGMTQGQLAGYVWKVDQAKKKAEESIEEELAAKSVVKAIDVKPEPTKAWGSMSSDEKLTYAHEQGYEWKLKPNSTHGNHAWYDKEGNQVSAFGPKESHREKLDTINYGQGIVPKIPDVAPAAGEWPISVDTERRMSSAYVTEMSKAHSAWGNSLTGIETHAIGNYTGSGYSDLNAALRADSGLSSYQAGMNKSLNSAIDKAPSPPPPDLVWRGISSNGAASLFAGLKNGDQLTMKGFQSTSIKPSFAQQWGAGKILFEIKPSKGAYVKLHSGHPHEYEYLLPHNAKYTVRGISHVKLEGVSSKVRVLQLEMH